MEIERFGFNLVTVSFLGTLAFSVAIAWGYWRQARRIWGERSGHAVSTPVFVYQLAVRGPIVIYGLHIGSLALLANALLPMLPLLLVIAGLGKFKGFSRRDYWLIIGLVSAIIGTALLPHLEKTFLVWCAASVWSAALLPYEMWRVRSAGAVEPRMLLVGLANSGFWTIYAFAIADLPLMLLNPAFLLTHVAALLLWRRYRRRDVAG